MGKPKDQYESASVAGRERWGRRTIDDPALDFSRGHLKRRGNLRVWQVLPDVLKAKICEGQWANFALKLGRVQAYFV